MRNDTLEGLKIIEKFTAKKRKDRRRFYFWYSDALQHVLPVEIIKIDTNPNNCFNVMVHYQPNGYNTWDNRLVRACDLFNSRKELQEVVIARKLKAIEKINHEVCCGTWHKSEVSPDEVKETLWKDIEILRNM